MSRTNLVLRQEIIKRIGETPTYRELIVQRVVMRAMESEASLDSDRQSDAEHEAYKNRDAN